MYKIDLDSVESKSNETNITRPAWLNIKKNFGFNLILLSKKWEK